MFSRISYTRQYLLEGKRSLIRLFVDLQALHDLPGIPLSTEHFAAYIDEAYFTFHKRKLLPIKFVMTF